MMSRPPAAGPAAVPRGARLAGTGLPGTQLASPKLAGAGLGSTGLSGTLTGRVLSGAALAAMVLAGAVLLAGCGGAAAPPAPASAAAPRPTAAGGLSAAPSAAPAVSASGTPRPVACTSVTSQGSFASASDTSAVTLKQISHAVGFTVSLSMPDTQSALAFNGYEGCRYSFDTPAGGAQEDLALVVGTNPLDAKSAAAEFAATRAAREPLSKRMSSCSGCGYSFTPLPGLGAAAVTGFQNGTDEVVAAYSGRVYVEIGPGDLKQARMVRLARLILSKVR